MTTRLHDPLDQTYQMDSVFKVSQFDQFTPLGFADTPRLSVIVPIGRDLLAFENTLISVLENKPQNCEVILAHDGSYDDPFQLCDEVRFAVADSDNQVELIQAGVKLANARFVHLLLPGLQTQLGWTDAALEKFEHSDCGSVACVIRDPNKHRIVSAGWNDSSSTFAENSCAGHREVTTEATQLSGAHLEASFWRRDLLLSLGDAFEASSSILEASVAYEYLCRSAGWRCVVATDCELLGEDHTPAVRRHGFRLAKQLSGLKSEIVSKPSLLAMLAKVAAKSVQPGHWMPTLGYLVGGLFGRVADRIDQGAVLSCASNEQVLSLPLRSSPVPNRRAA